MMPPEIVKRLVERLAFHSPLRPGCSCIDCQAQRDGSALVRALEQMAVPIAFGVRWAREHAA